LWILQQTGLHLPEQLILINVTYCLQWSKWAIVVNQK